MSPAGVRFLLNSLVPRARWWLQNRLRPGALILHYHRVADLQDDPFRLAVSPGHVDEQFEVLRRQTHPFTLVELTRRVRADKLPPRAVVITFDDGYADNLYQARPLLDRHELPATVFVASGYLDQQAEFWWDDLERCVLCPSQLPARLELRLANQTIAWELDLEDLPADSAAAWHLGQGPRSARQLLLDRLYQALQPLDTEQRNDALRQLQAWSGVGTGVRPDHRPLNLSELQAFPAGLVEIGAHSVGHPALAALSREQQQAEIRGSKTALEAVLGSPVESFAYPHGSHSAETVNLVRQAGFIQACSSRPGRVEQGADPFRLPRLEVRNWDGDRFAKWLQTWLPR